MDLISYLLPFLAGILVSLTIRINADRQQRARYLRSINDSFTLAKENAALRRTNNSLESINRKLKSALIRAHEHIEKTHQVPSAIELLARYARAVETGGNELETAEVVPLKN